MLSSLGTADHEHSEVWLTYTPPPAPDPGPAVSGQRADGRRSSSAGTVSAGRGLPAAARPRVPTSISAEKGRKLTPKSGRFGNSNFGMHEQRGRLFSKSPAFLQESILVVCCRRASVNPRY